MCCGMQAPTHLETGGPTYITSASYDTVMRSVGATVALVDKTVQAAKVCFLATAEASLLAACPALPVTRAVVNLACC